MGGSDGQEVGETLGKEPHQNRSFPARAEEGPSHNEGDQQGSPRERGPGSSSSFSVRGSGGPHESSVVCRVNPGIV